MFINNLYETIRSRKEEMPEGSYTSELFRRGIDRIAQKVGEESVEVVIAAKGSSRKRLVEELSDLTFHMMVLMVEKGVTIEDIDSELNTRSK